MSSFNWNDLQVFLAVVRTSSPVQAARLLKVNHTTVRRRLHSLETNLGARLLVRKRDGRCTLTVEGEALLRSAESVESLLRHTTTEIGDHDHRVSGVVRIGVPDGIGSYFLAPRLAPFRMMHPQLAIELVAISRVFNLSKLEADMAIVVARPNRGQHYVRTLGKVASRLYAARTYLEGRPPVSSVEDLSDHELIGYIDEFDFGAELSAAFGKYGVRYNPRFASTNLVAQLAAAKSGGGICMLPAYMIEGAELEPVLHDQFVIERQVWLLTHAELRDVARIRTVSDFIADAFARAKPMLSGHRR